MKKNSVSPIDSLSEEPLILRENDTEDKQVNRYLGKMEIDMSKLHVVARINDQEAVKNLVANGMGVSFISEIAARNYIDARRVISFDLQSDEGRMIYLAHKKHAELPAQVKQFIAYTESVTIHSKSHQEE